MKIKQVAWDRESEPPIPFIHLEPSEEDGIFVLSRDSVQLPGKMDTFIGHTATLNGVSVEDAEIIESGNTAPLDIYLVRREATHVYDFGENSLVRLQVNDPEGRSASSRKGEFREFSPHVQK